MTKLPRIAIIYGIWAAVSIGFSLVLAGPTAESGTRVLVLFILAAQLAARPWLPRFLPRFAPRTRFIALGMLLASVVEGFHMISTPVFPSLRISQEVSWALGLQYYGLDLLFTLPAYFLIFLAIWLFIERLYFPLWHYVLAAGFAQMLGDGGLFYFLGSPGMLAFLPYPISNYHAINVLPFLAVRESLPSGRVKLTRIYLIIPAVFATYFLCGALIQFLGQQFGLR